MATLLYDKWIAGIYSCHQFKSISIEGGLVIVREGSKVVERIPLPEPVVELPIPSWITDYPEDYQPSAGCIQRMFLSEARQALLAFSQRAAQLIVDAE